MSKSINKVTLLGNVGKDPEVRTTQSGSYIANLSLATSDRRKGANGDWTEETTWHSLVAFGKTAEVIRDYVTKGSKIYVEGKLQTQSWDDRNSGEKKYKTVIIINDLVLLSSSGEKRSGAHAQQSTWQRETNQYDAADNGEIPF